MCLCCNKGEGVLCDSCLKVGQQAPLLKCLKCGAYSFAPPQAKEGFGELHMGEPAKMYPIITAMLFIWSCPACEKPRLEKPTYLDEFTRKSKL